ncbi:MAG: MarR family winged helix-turn-helix transcriptional regulator [Actinomycetota bacterium]
MDYTELPIFGIHRLSFSLRKELSQRFTTAGYSVSPEEWAVLLVLWSRSPQTPGGLSDETIRDPTTVTRLIDRMVKKDLVVRSEDPNDRRRSNISLAPRGTELEHELVPIAFELIAQATAGIPPEDLETVQRTLGLLQQNLLNKD